jgi:hypothetical protein
MYKHFDSFRTRSCFGISFNPLIRRIGYVSSKRNIILRRKRNLRLLPIIKCFLIALNNNKFNLRRNAFKNYLQIVSLLRNYDYYLIEDLKINRKFLNNLGSYKSISNLERISKED